MITAPVSSGGIFVGGSDSKMMHFNKQSIVGGTTSSVVSEYISSTLKMHASAIMPKADSLESIEEALTSHNVTTNNVVQNPQQQ